MYQALQLGLDAQDVVWRLPLTFIMLMMRQKIFMESNAPGIQLGLIEKIDAGEI